MRSKSSAKVRCQLLKLAGPLVISAASKVPGTTGMMAYLRASSAPKASSTRLWLATCSSVRATSAGSKPLRRATLAAVRGRSGGRCCTTAASSSV